MIIQAERVGALWLVRVRGALSLPDAPRVLDALCRGLQERPRVVVCDLSGLAPAATPSQLTVFPAALRRGGGWPHAALHLAAAGPDLARQLDEEGIHRFLPVYGSLAEACEQAQRDVLANPLQFDLAPDPGALHSLRIVVEDAWESRPEQRQDAVLIAHELASNAVRHVGLPSVVYLAPAPVRGLIAVSDPSRREPRLLDPDPDAPDGRGLRLVARLSQDWGVRPVYQDGKTVWASLPAAPPPIPRGRFPR